MDVSIVIPVYNEEGSIKTLYEELKKILKNLGKNYELIFIDDGSGDRSFEILEDLNKKDKKVVIIKFRKNFGQTSAISAGFEKARGDVIITMDADLQNDPYDIPKLLSKIGDGYDVVSGWRKDRNDPLITKKIPSKISNCLARTLTGVEIHDSGCTLKAYRKESLKNLELYGEMHRFISAMIAWKGFGITEVPVAHHARKFGETKYGPWRIMKGFLDLLVVVFWRKYSTRPIHLFGSLGILMGFFGFLISTYLTFMKIIYNQSLTNRPLLLLGILLIILGVQFIIFGLIADILIKLYYKKDEKPYAIEKIIG